MVVVAAASSAGAATRYDPRLHFRTIRTAHFDIHAHQGEELLAQRLAVIAERIRDRFAPMFGVARGRVQVILVDQTDVSNGWATPFPYDTIEIDAVAPAAETLIGNASDWVELAFTHEYTHILHLDRARGFMQGVRSVFGRAPLVFPNSYLPIWQIEGLAVFEESRMTGEGRIPEGDFRAIVDVAAARGRFEPIDRAGGGLVDWPAGNAPYAYGAYFHQYLADRFGAERLSRLADATAGRVPFFGDGAFKQVFGRSSGDLWADFRTEREHASARAAGTERDDRQSRPVRLTHSGYQLTALDVGDDGVIRYADTNADRFPALMELRPGGAPHRVAWRAGGSRTSAAAGWIVFDRLERVRSIALYTDLYAVRIGTDRVVRLTRQARAGDPDLSRSGRSIVCTVQRAGRRALALLDFDPASPRPGIPRVIADDAAADYTGPRWSPDATSIAVARQRAGIYEIVVVDPVSGNVAPLVARRDARLVTPSWTPDGRTILFSANVGDAAFNVFAADVSTGAVRQVTDTVGGAQFPFLSTSGTLTYVGYTPDGYDVFSMQSAAADWKAVDLRLKAEATERPAEAGRPAEATERTASASRSVRAQPDDRRYAPLRTLTPTYWNPLIRTDAGETLFGGGTLMSDALGRHTYAANVSWSAARARPDWDVSYAYDRWRPTLFASYSDDTDPIRGGDFRARELDAGMLLPFRRIRWAETLMTAFDAENDTNAAETGFAFADRRRVFRSIRGGWLHDSRRQFGYSIGAEEGFSIEGAAETSRTAFGSDADGGAAIFDARGFRRLLGTHTVLAARAAAAMSGGPAGSRRVFSAAGPGGSIHVFDFGRDTIGLLRGFNPEDVLGTRALVVNVDVRVPVWRVERGAGTWPVFLRTVHAAGFLDAGSAWTGQFRTSDVRTSAGGELSFDTTLAHYVPFTFASGAAWTRDPVAGNSAVQLFGRIGYAF